VLNSPSSRQPSLARLLLERAVLLPLQAVPVAAPAPLTGASANREASNSHPCLCEHQPVSSLFLIACLCPLFGVCVLRSRTNTALVASAAVRNTSNFACLTCLGECCLLVAALRGV
jgi:hypothetical protein